MRRTWLPSQSGGGEPGCGEPVCLSLLSSLSLSLGALCLSLAVAVCHAAERRGRTVSPHASIPLQSPVAATSKGRRVVLVCLHAAKKAPPPPEGPLLFLRRSICRAFASIHLPSYPSSCILATFLFDYGSGRSSVRSHWIPQWLLFGINTLGLSLSRT